MRVLPYVMLLLSVVSESALASTRQEMIMTLIGSMEANLVLLRQELRLASLECGGQPETLGIADVPPPPPPMSQTAPATSHQASLAKSITEMNLFELSDAIARNNTYGTNVVLVVDFDESNTTRYCIDRFTNFGLYLRQCTPEPVNQLWVRKPSGEICVPGNPDQCLHYDSTISDGGLGVFVHSASQRQQWVTHSSGQLQEQGTDICLGVLPASNFRVIAVSCSNTPLTTIAFAHPFASKLFRPLGLQRRHQGSSRHRFSSSTYGSSKYEQNDHISRLDAHGAQVVIRVN
jgi:hypothetical protein